MATVSNLPATRTAPPAAAADDGVGRLMSIIEDGVRAGTGRAELQRGRGDDFNFGALAQIVSTVHPECVEPLHRVLDSRRLLRGSAEVMKCTMVRLVAFALASSIDPFDCSNDELLDLLGGYRDGGGVGGARMSAGACRNAKRLVTLFHLVAGNRDPVGTAGDDGAIVLKSLLNGFEKEDQDFSGGRPGVPGVMRREMPPAIGYQANTPVTMAHVSRLNARAGGFIQRTLLREQVRALVVRETHSDVNRLALLQTTDCVLGAKPALWIAARADGTGAKQEHPISPPLARMLRVLLDDLTGNAGGPPWPRTVVFQCAVGTGRMVWTGTPSVTNTSLGLRRMLIAAADQARARGENDLGSVDDVAAFVGRITYESIRDGLLVDCHAAGVPKVALAVFLRKQRIVEIDNMYRRQDQRRGEQRGR